MATGLARAAGRFDKAFAALPASAQQAAALAIYRAAPAIEQYQRDLEPLAESPELIEAMWDLMIAAGARIALRGRAAIGATQIAEMREAAPHTSEFIEGVGRLLAGLMPGVRPAAPAALAAPAAIVERSLPPPDGEIVE